MNVFTNKFISAGLGIGDAHHPHTAPLLRKTFVLKQKPQKASLLITGVGFYKLFINGKEITRGHLSPYISDPGLVLEFDKYDIAPYLDQGQNVIGIMLGSGFRAPVAGNRDTMNSLARGDMLTALVCDIDGECFEADESFRVHSSPIVMNDLRFGEHYDARLEDETCGWTLPDFDDSSWGYAVRADAPRGEQRICATPPIKTRYTLTPVKIWQEGDGFVYDFGQNGAGLLCIHTDLPAGRRISVEFAEYLWDGKFYNETITGGTPRTKDYPFGSQNFIYDCRGGEQHYKASFTYQGFRYAKVYGITAQEAKPELLTFEVMSSQMRERGSFNCSDPVANAIQRMTREATHSNMYHIPTDCPHREKNGWTADAAVSSVHMLLNLECDGVFNEWMHSVAAAVDKKGAMPGCVPAAPGVFYDSWNGPGWDAVLVELPYRMLELRDDLKSARVAAPAMLRYVAYTLTRRDERGLVHIGLGDWMPPHDPIKAPLELTDTIMCFDIARKAAFIYHKLGMKELCDFCLGVAKNYKAAVREHLIDLDTCTAAGNCQTSQAMAICLGIFDKDEMPLATKVLSGFAKELDEHIDCGVLGMRYIFRALSMGGYTDLAYRMAVNPTAPSYGDMVARGETTLAEDFNAKGQRINSRNHHFLGDISAWFIDTVCGIRVDPQVESSLDNVFVNGGFADCDGASRVDIIPHLPESLTFAEAYHETPYGTVSVKLERVREDWISVKVKVDGELHGRILPPEGYLFDGCGEYPLETGEFDAFRH